MEIYLVKDTFLLALVNETFCFSWKIISIKQTEFSSIIFIWMRDDR